MMMLNKQPQATEEQQAPGQMRYQKKRITVLFRSFFEMEGKQRGGQEKADDPHTRKNAEPLLEIREKVFLDTV
jgi:hypothetical protein